MRHPPILQNFSLLRLDIAINGRAYIVMQKVEESYCPRENLTEVDVEQELKKTNKSLMNASNLQVGRFSHRRIKHYKKISNKLKK